MDNRKEVYYFKFLSWLIKNFKGDKFVLNPMKLRKL